MSVSHDEVRRIAALARIGVSDERVPGLAHELSGILAHMAVLQRVATDAIAADHDVAQTPWRIDRGPPMPLLRPLEAFAPEVRDAFLIVPRLATHGGRSAVDGSPSPGDDDAAAGPVDLPELP
jgi:aspartyl-tRNA(Asn)/glutamyl-tRNA(Gln) amidotransferase subunit C